MQAGAGPLTLDLQDLVTEVGLEVEGAVGREHEPQAGGGQGGGTGHCQERLPCWLSLPEPGSWVERPRLWVPSPGRQGHFPS